MFHKRDKVKSTHKTELNFTCKQCSTGVPFNNQIKYNPIQIA